MTVDVVFKDFTEISFPEADYTTWHATANVVTLWKHRWWWFTDVKIITIVAPICVHEHEGI